MPAGKQPDVTIIGGGIIGCALAYDLSHRGIDSCIVERGELAREASWASAGIISLPAPRHGSLIELSLRSYRRYAALIAEVEACAGIDVGYVRSGEIELGMDDDEGALDELARWHRSNGMAAELLDERALREREPSVSERYTRGMFAGEAASVDLARLAQALARGAVQRGARVLEHSPVVDIEIRGSRATAVRTPDQTLSAGAVVIAAGAWSRMLGDLVRFSIPTVPVKGQMMAIAQPPVPLRSIVAGGGGYCVPRADRTIAVGATEEHDAGFDTSVTPAGVAWLEKMASALVPSLVHGKRIATWAGLRPGTAHGEPVIGRIPHLDNVWVATGHFRSGALLAPATAEALADSIVSGVLDPALTPFGPGRAI